MGLLNFFKRKGTASARDAGLDQEHLELRRAIERCDALRAAYVAKQLTIEDLVATLERNNFSKATIKKAVEESLGADAARRV